MILSEYVSISINNKRDIYYYNNLGYDINGIGTIIDILVDDIPMYSLIKLEVKCDYCDNTKLISKKTYNLNTNFGKKLYACSQKCSRFKNKNTIIEKYGVDNISKLDFVKQKKVDTCLKNHSVEYPQMSSDIFKKSKETKLEKYGNENYNNLDKMKETMFKIYGFEHPSLSPEIKIKQKITFAKYIKSQILDNDFYKSINIVDYQGNDTYTLKCDLNKLHNYISHYKLLYTRYKSKSVLCTICNPINQSSSGKEIQVLEWIKSIYNDTIISNNRDIIKPNEIDIFLPKLKIGIEFNGLYWHSEEYKNKNYHLDKLKVCNSKGIDLIQIWEDDWTYKQNIIKSLIKNKLGLSEKIWARKCVVKEIVNNTVVKNFLNNNHLQGYCNSKIKLGLYYNDELVSIMTFGKLRKPKNSKGEDFDYEMIRFCNKLDLNIIGGVSKLFTYFIKKYKFNDIISYADKSYFNGKVYEKLGFTKISDGSPSYYYIVNDIKVHRFNFRKDKLVKLGYDPNKTEKEIMTDRGIRKIWTAGNIKYKFNI